MIVKDGEFKQARIEKIAEAMCLAARTAPKARGLDLLEVIVIKGKEDIAELSKKMLNIGQQQEHKTFLRDGENILKAAAIVIIGTRRQALQLKYCGLCGYADCAANDKAGGMCAFNPGDLGIAIGSAVSVAMDNRLDNRIMYTVGKAAIELGWLGPKVKLAYGIPLSATGKNPFFDRK
ncbi:MAG: ferredoxin [Candidatus Saganbacteria bacterium]|nr:ferredoxin [Candidatus Saganbacteria bacterium]